jgi:hypothetical protein
MRFTDKECAAICVLAGWFNENRKGFISREEAMQAFSMTLDEYVPFMQRMEESRAITGAGHSSAGRCMFFNAGSAALDLAEKIDAQKRERATPDVVDQLRRRFKTNPVAAWIIVVLGALTFLATLANQLLSLWEKTFARH